MQGDSFCLVAAYPIQSGHSYVGVSCMLVGCKLPAYKTTNYRNQNRRVNNQHTRNTNIRLSRLYMQPPNNNFLIALTVYRLYHTKTTK